jgi:peptidoglycan/xylan/chitin deacetylase (PgdA/CDA1 family)
MQIIFRDDDTSFFTTPQMLEDVYTPVWEHNCPVCLAVIPAQHGNIVLDFGSGTFIDPNIAPQYRGQDRTFPITDNAELCAYLNDKARQGLVEICLHGYDHRYPEFRTDDEGLIRQKLTEGKAILERAFPNAVIETFLTPYDAISSTALDIILEMGFHTALGMYNIPQESKLAGSTPNRGIQSTGGGKFYTIGADYTQHFDHWMSMLADEDATLVSVNHYYMFYNDFDGHNERAFEEWDRLIQQTLPKYAANVTTFKDAVVK